MNEEKYKKILDNLYEGVYFVDPERRITYWNKGAERITGFKKKQVVGHRCMDNILNHVTENGVQLCLNGCPLHATLKDGKLRQAEVFLHHADGYRLPILLRTTPIYDEDRNIIGAVETFTDNSSLLSVRRQAKLLKRRLLTDPGTGIGNRRQIEIKLQSALAEYAHHHIPSGILFIDIDEFKRVNDSLGHDIGDRVLKMVANTLSMNVRGEDVVARWGGEEFIVLLADVDAVVMEKVAEKLRALIEKSCLTLNDQDISVTISIGATLVRTEDNIDSIIRRADQNMYRSKQNGRNRVTMD
jgi:diguanylate cyclase (GGDEF)-like protein/PAS domain S-box-containing protein